MSLRINAEDLRNALNRRGKVFRDEVDRAFTAAGHEAVNLSKAQAKGLGVQDRTNRLADSFGYRVLSKGSNDHKLRRRLEVYSAGIPYARVQEYGATIRPRRKKWLTIPLPDAKTAKGVTRGPARSFEDTFFRRSRKGNLLLSQRVASGEIRNLFVLKKRVRVPGRLGFRKVWTDQAEPFLLKRVRYAIHRALS